MSWRNFTVLAFSSQANPTVIASQRRSNPSVVLHYLKYGLPRRFAPRNDKSEWSLRAEGEAIHLKPYTTWNIDCHVATLLAMTGIWFHCEPTPPVIASRRRSNPSFVLHRLKHRLPRRDAPRNDRDLVSLRSAPPSLRAEGEAIHLSSCTAWNMEDRKSVV